MQEHKDGTGLLSEHISLVVVNTEDYVERDVPLIILGIGKFY